MLPRLCCAVALPAAALALTACSPAAAPSASPTTFAVQQAKPVLSTQLKEPGSSSMGDTLDFVAPLTRDGKPAGIVLGNLRSINLPGDGIGAEEEEERIAALVFRFSPTDTITVVGASLYTPQQAEMAVERPQLRAVTGGTGAYIGARGQVTTTRGADGTYRHEFVLLP